MSASRKPGALPPLHGRVALYGGSFDPPHLGHQMACLYLLEALGAAQVVLVPTAGHAFGKQLHAFHHRRAMVTAMAAPFGARVEVSAVEQELGGTSTTLQTLEALAARQPGRVWAVVVGQDLLPELPRWRQAEALFARAGLVVLGRAGVPAAPPPAFPPRPWLAEAALPLPEVASRDLRRRAAEGQSLAGWVPHAVAHYIAQHKLYRAAAPAADPA